MLNFIFSPSVLLGFILGLAVIIFYYLRFIMPDLGREEDIFFSTLGLIYSGILVIHGWRLDPILLFSQVLVATSLISSVWENIRLRGLTGMLMRRQNKIEKEKKIN